MQAGLNIGASMLSLKKPPGAVKRHHHAGPEVKDHRKFFLDVPPQVVAAAATSRRGYCKGALEAEGVLAMHGDQLLREVKGDLVSKFEGTRTALPQRSSHPTRLLSVPAVLASRVLSPAAVDGDKGHEMRLNLLHFVRLKGRKLRVNCSEKACETQ